MSRAASTNSGADRSDQKRTSLAGTAVQILNDNYRFVRSTDGQLMAIPLTGVSIARSVDSVEFLTEISARVYEKTGCVLSSGDRKNALDVAAGKARNAPTVDVPMRVGATPSCERVLDLGRVDGKCVVLGRGSWEILDGLPVDMRRSPAMLELPLPRRGNGSAIHQLRDLLGLEEHQIHLLISWLVKSLDPKTPTPVLAFIGEAGSGKSTAAEAVVSILDPSCVPLQPLPRPEELGVVTGVSYITVADNVSRLSEEQSNALCRLCTGGAVVRRALYTNADASISTFRRPFVFTAVDFPDMRDDLVDRTLTIFMRDVGSRERKTLEDMQARLDSLRGEVLAEVLDIAVEAWASPTPQHAPTARMMDFGRLLMSIDAVRDWSVYAAFIENQQASALRQLEASPVAEAIARLMENYEFWSGSCSDLLCELVNIDDVDERQLPSNARSLSSALKPIRPTLRKLGISLTRTPRTSHRRSGVEITRRTDSES